MNQTSIKVIYFFHIVLIFFKGPLLSGNIMSSLSFYMNMRLTEAVLLR